MKVPHLSRIEIGLLSAIAALFLVFAYELVAAPPSFDHAKIQMRSDPLPKAIVPENGLAASLLQDFSEASERPLFDPSRRPSNVAAASTVVAPPPPMSLVLVGVILGGDQKIALIRTPSSQSIINARVGKVIDGWELVRIESNRVVFKSSGQEQDIKLK